MCTVSVRDGVARRHQRSATFRFGCTRFDIIDFIDPTKYQTSMLSMSEWMLADDATRLATARSVAERVDGRVIEIDREDGGRPMPAITVRGVLMVLVPGDTVTLGCEVSEEGVRKEMANWPEEDDASATLAWMADRCTPRRIVTVEPFLIEIGATPIEEPDPDDRSEALLETIAARVAEDGFRLATDDEWEHAVRAGSTSLFRWGDAWPDGVPHRDETSFRAHRERSTLGLRMLDDTYGVELVSHPLGFRGGDGGNALCEGTCELEAWFTLSPSYRDPREAWVDLIPEWLETAHVRRALSIPPRSEDA